MRESFSKLRQLEHHIDDTIRLYDNVQTDDYPAHWNIAFEVILPVENEYTVYVGETVYAVQPDEVLIIPAGSVHEIYAPPEGGRRFIFMIDQSQFYAVDGLAGVQHCFYPCVHLRNDLHADILSEVRVYLQNAIEEYSAGETFGGAAVRLWLNMMFLKVGRYLISEHNGDRPTHQRHQQSMAVFLDVCTYIADHCSEKLTLADVAAYSGYSKYHFARMFKVYSGMSFYDFFLRQRVLLCEQLLSDPSLSITEVAMRSGFGSIATFNRIFKQYEKTTPSEYRRLRQRISEEGNSNI